MNQSAWLNGRELQGPTHQDRQSNFTLLEKELQMETLGLLAFVFVIYIAIPQGARREDPFYLPPSRVASKQGPKFNEKVQDHAWADAYVDYVATSGTASLTDGDVRRAYSEIVNNAQLTDQAKYYMLDGLYQRTMNDHPRGAGADVLEEISNESIALDHPDWHGCHGNWQSAKDQ
jgi:hypothetical protein